jgi:hypothetical protein
MSSKTIGGKFYVSKYNKKTEDYGTNIISYGRIKITVKQSLYTAGIATGRAIQVQPGIEWTGRKTFNKGNNEILFHKKDY